MNVLQAGDGGDKARDPVAIGEVLGEVRGVCGAGGAAGGGHGAACAGAQSRYAARRQVTRPHNQRRNTSSLTTYSFSKVF